MNSTITRELRFAQPPERVWQALARREALAEWMYPNDFEPRLGHRFSFHVPASPGLPGGLVVDCEVLACDPPTTLRFSWVVGSFLDTRVSYRLEADGQGTVVYFEHSGFTQPQARGGAEYGWRAMHHKLAELLTPVGGSS